MFVVYIKILNGNIKIIDFFVKEKILGYVWGFIWLIWNIYLYY